jgi:integrase
MAKTATLLERRKEGSKYRYISVQWGRNHKPIPGAQGSRYYVRPGSGDRTPINVGKNFDLAVLAWERWTPEKPVETPKPEKQGKPTIADAVAAYEVALESKSATTKRNYMYAVRDFVSTCKKTYVHEIETADLLSYRDGLRGSGRTQYNKMERVVIWFNTLGIKGLVKKGEWPEYEEPVPDSYDADELIRILDVRNPRYPLDPLKLQFCLMSGFRRGEIIHAEFPDIDYRNCTLTTRPKPHWGWEPKKTSVKDRKKAGRVIRIPSFIVAQIAELRLTVPNPDGLIFPNSNGVPDTHLLRVVKRAANAAGVEGRVSLHKFRRTFATMYAKKQGINDAAVMLGHKHLDQIQRYLAATKPESEEQRESTEGMFTGVVPANYLTMAAGK